jgi:phytoene dehydrogenase-like protein
MNHEVIVVGGGIGGLTVATLLAARGVDVCLFERQSHIGGCVAKFEHLGRSFDPTFGLFSGWEAGGVWERVFVELRVGPPPVTKLSTNFVVRLPDGTDVPVSSDQAALKQDVVNAFPDCADTAVNFIRGALECRSDLESLKQTNENFRAFIDAQLTFLAQRTIDTAEPSRITDALSLATGELCEIDGGAQSLADRLAAGFKQSGGKLRLNAPVLRLAYADNGTPNGVDLLSGERATATHAIISNLTVWDTYGKLVGLRRTPSAVAAQLKQMNGWGVYQIFMLIDEAAVATLPSRRMIFTSSAPDIPPAHMMLNIEQANDHSRSTGKHCATLTTFTDAAEWFAFHEDTTWHEGQDQAMLEKTWRRLHAAAPEITNGAEVFETATPQTFYESVRRKMGMIGPTNPRLLQSSTHLDKLFMVGDTVSQGIGLAGIADETLRLVGILHPEQK